MKMFTILSNQGYVNLNDTDSVSPGRVVFVFFSAVKTAVNAGGRGFLYTLGRDSHTGSQCGDS